MKKRANEVERLRKINEKKTLKLKTGASKVEQVLINNRAMVSV